MESSQNNEMFEENGEQKNRLNDIKNGIELSKSGIASKAIDEQQLKLDSFSKSAEDLDLEYAAELQLAAEHEMDYEIEPYTTRDSFGKTQNAVREQEERVSNEPRTFINFFGFEYDVNTELRKQFPDSYFLPDGYDDAICGINCITGGVIYDWMHLGFMRILNSAEPSYGDLGDRIWGAVNMTEHLEKLTDEDLQGKVRPSILISERDYCRYWDDRYEYS